MKKFIVIATAVVLALILSILIMSKISDNNTEKSMPDVQKVEPVQEKIITDDEKTSDETVKNEIKKEITIKNEKVSKPSKSVKYRNKKVQRSGVQTKSNTEPINITIIKDTNTTSQKFTSEEEELLRKIPRSEEVVVDKEIKIKSSGKYVFK